MSLPALAAVLLPLANPSIPAPAAPAATERQPAIVELERVRCSVPGARGECLLVRRTARIPLAPRTAPPARPLEPWRGQGEWLPPTPAPRTLVVDGPVATAKATETTTGKAPAR
jgi:hypothetical protein